MVWVRLLQQFYLRLGYFFNYFILSPHTIFCSVRALSRRHSIYPLSTRLKSLHITHGQSSEESRVLIRCSRSRCHRQRSNRSCVHIPRWQMYRSDSQPHKRTEPTQPPIVYDWICHNSMQYCSKCLLHVAYIMTWGVDWRLGVKGQVGLLDGEHIILTTIFKPFNIRLHWKKCIIVLNRYADWHAAVSLNFHAALHYDW